MQLDQYGVDQTRFFLMSEVGFGNDGDYSNERMVQKVNTNLANELGNLSQRTLSMVFKNCNKAVPAEIGEYTPEDEALLAKAKELKNVSGEAISNQAIHKYADACVSLVREANKYIDEMAPWGLKKTDPERMATVLYVIMETLRHVAILYQPLMPTSANAILDQLTVPENERTFEYLDTSPIRPGTPISKPVGIFPRIEVEQPVA